MLTARLSPASPRVRFETVQAEWRNVLPRMDVAVFVGFAASGPLHVPVAVEDDKQYRAIFGADPALARDPQTGETQHALLGPTVRTFFANGGRRCWVIRVAGKDAVHNYFPVPGLLRCGRDHQGKDIQEPAFARARSEGSWSDALGLRAALRARVFPVESFDVEAGSITLSAADNFQTRAPGPQDLIRLQFGDAATTRYVLFARAVPSPSSPTDPNVRYELTDMAWFADQPLAAPVSGDIHVNVSQYSTADVQRPPSYFFLNDPYAEPDHVSQQTRRSAILRRPAGEKSRLILADSINVEVGELLGIGSGDDRGWFAVRKVRQEQAEAAGLSPPPSGQSQLVLDGDLYWLCDRTAARFTPGVLRSGEIVSFDLVAEAGTDNRQVLSDIGCAPGHARYWSNLPGDQRRFRSRANAIDHELVREARAAAFPFSSPDTASFDVYVPLGMLVEFSNPVHAIPQSAEPIVRDGLASFDPSLFLDRDLAGTTTVNLMNEADYLRYYAPRPRPLCGLHAALGFEDSRIGEEATLISVPDVANRRWICHEPSLPGRVQQAIKSDNNKPPLFANCQLSTPPVPVFGYESPPQPLMGGRFTLTWTSGADARYVLEEAESDAFEHPSPVYEGPGTSIDIQRPAGGRYSYRVQTLIGGQKSPWSAPITIEIPTSVSCTLQSVDDPTPSIAVHEVVHPALLQLCAASGQLFAALSLPRHYREQESRKYLSRLSTTLAPERSPSTLSYGAIYHPWVHSRDERGAIAVIPPDGVAVGVMAARAATRGAWVAPANQNYRGVVALDQRLAGALEDDTPINLVRDEPQGFMALRADTLDTVDPDLRLINVRRLLILLRRLALREGATYAFEPNGSALRRLVQSRFEGLLRSMYDRGALGGPTAAHAYQVSTGETVNTPQSVDQGRLIVELRVRPSLPMEFITVRLVQRGDQLSVVEAR